VYGPGTTARVFSECTTCTRDIEFGLRVTADGAVSESPIAATLREFDPIVSKEDRARPHMLDGL
jgi:hypothetical protein